MIRIHEGHQAHEETNLVPLRMTAQGHTKMISSPVLGAPEDGLLIEFGNHSLRLSL